MKKILALAIILAVAFCVCLPMTSISAQSTSQYIGSSSFELSSRNSSYQKYFTLNGENTFYLDATCSDQSESFSVRIYFSGVLALSTSSSNGKVQFDFTSPQRLYGDILITIDYGYAEDGYIAGSFFLCGEYEY